MANHSMPVSSGLEYWPAVMFKLSDYPSCRQDFVNSLYKISDHPKYNDVIVVTTKHDTWAVITVISHTESLLVPFKAIANKFKATIYPAKSLSINSIGEANNVIKSQTNV